MNELKSLCDARQMAFAPDFVTPPDRIVRRGGHGPEQPEWDDVQTYSAEWYRRFRLWHHAEFADADQVTRDNLDTLVEVATIDGGVACTVDSFRCPSPSACAEKGCQA